MFSIFDMISHGQPIDMSRLTAPQVASRSPRGMNVMIPMAGRGSRFSREGYRLPKPMIKIVGRPMLLWLLDHLMFSPEDTLWVGAQKEMEEDYGIEALLRKEYPAVDIRVVSIDFQTRGAAETLFVMLQHMSPSEVRRKSISLDCDTIYFSDVLGGFRSCPRDCGCSFYFEDEGNKPIYSYICFEPGTRTIVRIREKVAISRQANTGAYAFPCGEQLRKSCRDVLDNPVGKAGEFYTSTIIAGMIQAGQKFVGIHVPDFHCVGTPAQLRSFLTSVRTGAIKPRYKVRVCFDLDGSLLAVRLGLGKSGAAGVRPIENNVCLLQELKAAGHYIIVETSRVERSPTDGSKERPLSGAGALTLESLRRFGVFYDELVLGKPMADVYIDGKTCNARGDMEKEVGWCLPLSGNGERTAATAENFMVPRSFNKIAILNDQHVVKSAPIEYLRGELNFYRSIPAELSALFPKLVEGNDDPSEELPSIIITKIDGVSFSHLVTNHCVTRGRFMKLLRGLAAVHAAKRPTLAAPSWEPPTNTNKSSMALAGRDKLAIAPCESIKRAISPERSPEDLPPSTMCANLHAKVRDRLQRNESVYCGFDGIDILRVSETILSYLHDYKEGARFRRAEFVHGDPVFSNCLLNKDSDVVFIDMRGSLGDVVCTEGDVNYDLSKVYQSLCGYDFIILDKALDQTTVDILGDLKENVFWPFVRQYYPGTLPRDIAALAASHFLSIVPLHEDHRHRARFLKACESILHEQGLLPRS